MQGSQTSAHAAYLLQFRLQKISIGIYVDVDINVIYVKYCGLDPLYMGDQTCNLQNKSHYYYYYISNSLIIHDQNIKEISNQT